MGTQKVNLNSRYIQSKALGHTLKKAQPSLRQRRFQRCPFHLAIKAVTFYKIVFLEYISLHIVKLWV